MNSRVRARFRQDTCLYKDNILLDNIRVVLGINEPEPEHAGGEVVVVDKPECVRNYDLCQSASTAERWVKDRV